MTITEKIKNWFNPIEQPKHINKMEFQTEVKELQTQLLANGFTFQGNIETNGGYISTFINSKFFIWITINQDGSLMRVFRDVNFSGKELTDKLFQTDTYLESATEILDKLIPKVRENQDYFRLAQNLGISYNLPNKECSKAQMIENQFSMHEHIQRLNITLTNIEANLLDVITMLRKVDLRD